MWITTNYGTGKKENYYNESEYQTIKGTLKVIKSIINLGRKDCKYALTCEVENYCSNYKLRVIEKVINEVLKDENEQKS